jgi:dipeptidyl aminopeptidase/acylaminoacyl peptidase
LSGGAVRVLADSGVGPWGLAWSADGFVYASSNSPANVGILRMPAEASADVRRLEVVTSPDTSGTSGHLFPVALPDGRGILFTVQPGTSVQQAMIAVVRPGKGRHRELMRGVAARYSPTGHLLVLTADGTLVAAPFDLKTLELTGDPVAIIPGLRPPLAFDGTGELHLTDDGTLWYQTGERAQDLRPVWVTRRGVETPVRPDWEDNFGPIAISPDGRRLAFSVNDGNQERLWYTSLDGNDAPVTLLEREGALNFRPSWSADGRTLAWISNRGGPNAPYFRSVDAQAKAQLLLPPSVTLNVWEVAYARRSPWVLFRAESNGSDIFGIRPGVDSVPVGLLTTAATERQPSLSPDGRWLAYISDEDGMANVYVRPFPNVGAAVWQITTAGGLTPRWSPDGRELYYVSAAGNLRPNKPSNMMAVQVRAGEGFSWSGGEVLFEMSKYVVTNNSFGWDVSPRDGRFLMLKRLDSGERPRLVMAEHFTTELLEKMKR